jgi:hypothetical protein
MTTLPDYRSCVDDAWARQWTSRTRVPAYMLDRAKAEVQAEADALLANQDARQGGVASAGDVDRMHVILSKQQILADLEQIAVRPRTARRGRPRR